MTAACLRLFSSLILGTLRSEDGDGRENVAEKSESAFFQSSLRLVQVTTLSNVGEPPVKLNSWEPYPSSERERKFSRRLCTSSVHREISHLHVVVVQWRQRKVQKSVVLLIKPIAFVAFPLPSPSSDLKVPSDSLAKGETFPFPGGKRNQFNPKNLSATFV